MTPNAELKAAKEEQQQVEERLAQAVTNLEQARTAQPDAKAAYGAILAGDPTKAEREAARKEFAAVRDHIDALEAEVEGLDERLRQANAREQAAQQKVDEQGIASVNKKWNQLITQFAEQADALAETYDKLADVVAQRQRFKPSDLSLQRMLPIMTVRGVTQRFRSSSLPLRAWHETMGPDVDLHAQTDRLLPGRGMAVPPDQTTEPTLPEREEFERWRARRDRVLELDYPRALQAAEQAVAREMKVPWPVEDPPQGFDRLVDKRAWAELARRYPFLNDSVMDPDKEQEMDKAIAALEAEHQKPERPVGDGPAIKQAMLDQRSADPQLHGEPPEPAPAENEPKRRLV